MSSVDGIPLVDPANVIFSVAREYVGGWLATTMSWLVLSSLFAGLLAFQNSAARYFFAMGRSGVLPKQLGEVNKAGAPVPGSIATSVVTAIVIIWFAITDKDPVLNLFFWFSAVAVVAIVLVEFLVCLAVIAFFHRENPGDVGLWKRMIAPILAAVGLASGLYLLMSRFGLLAGTVPKASTRPHRCVESDHPRLGAPRVAVHRLRGRARSSVSPAGVERTRPLVADLVS